MDTIRLRTLTEKSTLGFGTWKECKVQDLLTAGKTRILRWYYYNASNISFSENVLEQIYIKPEDRIKKPGKDPEKGIELDAELESKIKGITKWRLDKRHKKRIKGKAVGYFKRDSIKYTKKNLQWVNQGHK